MSTGDGVERAAGNVPRAGGLALPVELVRQLDDFRSAVRRVKGIEAVCTTLSGVLLAWGVLFVVDRFTETPGWVRGAVFVAAVAACAALPVAWRRWFHGLRGIPPVARLVARRYPSLGDEVLGAAELVGGKGEERHSRVLCEAAVRQVAARAGRHDLRTAIPSPRHRQWMAVAALPLLAALGAIVVVPEAAANAWRRLVAPWAAVPRHTFARVAPLPDEIVVPHGESVAIPVRLAEDSVWRPARATARLDAGTTLRADLDGDGYVLPVPPQVSERGVRLAVGDARQRVRLLPTMRPAISAVTARVRLPEYLGIEAPLERELRGGGLTVVEGSRVAVSATADRALASATVDGAEIAPLGPTIAVAEVDVALPTEMTLAWRDTLGLDGGKPLMVKLVPRADEAPTIAVDGFAGRAVLLETETVRFSVRCRDDFGVERTGIEWRGEGTDAAVGETVLATGGPEQAALDAVGAFAPAELGIAPQTIQVRAFVEDRLPGRGRVHGPPTTLVVMTTGDHAAWVGDQIGRWRQQAAEVRDKEMELLARNEELAGLSAEELDTPEMRKHLRDQAGAERTNARRLGRLAQNGAELVRQAMRNPDFDAEALAELAEHVEAVAGMAAERMPRIGELLQAAAGAPKGSAGKPTPPGTPAPPTPKPAAPRVGEDRGPAGGGKPSTASPSAPVPSVVDRESGVGKEPDPAAAAAAPAGGAGGAGRLGLPSTTVAGPAKQGGGAAAPQAAQAQAPALEAALDEQRRLIEDFAAIAKQLADVMARLEGTTFVKRLKAAARAESKVGADLSGLLAGSFGRPSGPASDEALAAKLTLAERGNERVGERVAAVMDDLDAYAERRPLPALRSVLDDMRDLDVLGGLGALGRALPEETGAAIARAEFWSDTLDRWADELVPPPGNCKPTNGPSRPSVPPQVVLEAMQILEAEANLREETRVAEQRRAGLATAEFADRCRSLAAKQEALGDRVAALVRRLAAEGPPGPRRFIDEIERLRRDFLPASDEAASPFGPEIRLFREVERVMDEARAILASPDSGRRAIAAETEAIELLLATKACGGGGGGGGGGGAAPGGGSFGTTTDTALARLGRGVNALARPGAGEEEQAVGEVGRALPEEFRDGLDAYFNALERRRAGEEARP